MANWVLDMFRQCGICYSTQASLFFYMINKQNLVGVKLGEAHRKHRMFVW